MGEGLIERSKKTAEELEPPKEITAEERADEILKEFLDKDLIQPAKQGSSSVPKSFTVHPLIRSALIYLAQQNEFFYFDSSGNPTFELSRSAKACLRKENEPENR